MDLAQQRRGSFRRKSFQVNNETNADDAGNITYMQVPTTHSGQSNHAATMSWASLLNLQLTPQQRSVAYPGCIFVGGVLLCQIASADLLGHLFHRLCAVVVPLFTIASAFYWLALYVRRSWSCTSIYILFCACFGGEFLAQSAWRDTASTDDDASSYIVHPFLVGAVLLAVSVASFFSTLDTSHSAFVLVFISFVRFLACTSLLDLPQTARPFLAYFTGVVGVIGAKYMETVLSPPPAPAPGRGAPPSDGKLVLIKRRRSSSTAIHGFSSHRAGRRTSLPALMEKHQGSSASFEVALISEAHGLISDMLADSSLPLHVVSGLRAVGNLLKPDMPGTGATGGAHRHRISPMVSLSEATNYGSDNDDLPYTGERVSSLPKRLRRSLPPSLIRRMSTSTWTTTTSATGMPTLEPEPCRTRSSNFRLSRDNTPSASPSASRSPSPSSPTALVVPKSRSFSVAVPTVTAAAAVTAKKTGRDRRSCSGGDAAAVAAAAAAAAAADDRADGRTDGAKEWLHGTLCKRLNATSDYESNDSPSSSDHSDNVTGGDDQRPLDGATILPRDSGGAVQGGDVCRKFAPSSLLLNDAGWRVQHPGERTLDVIDPSSSSPLRPAIIEPPFDVKKINSNPLLDVKRLNEWDYPIFDLAVEAPKSVLSMVAYKLFSEVGLFDTFRIPLVEFLNYFHALEMGYREKPYHNRVHATDVLHGVYYFTTQPIPGLQQVNIDSDLFRRPASSSESDSDGERPNCKVQNQSFVAEDSYGIMGGNFPALELMALYTAAAMHDYDHPGRTNAFLVTTHAPLAVLYNDRSVLESHHAASVWCLFLSDPRHNWLLHLDKAEFKRFRFLVIEAILATDLKQHFELLAEFNAKAADEDAPGIDWTSETDRLMVANMVIKMADINGPCKTKELHIQWTDRISEEFYEQGDEESRLGLQISPYMDRKHPQLAKLQESFINHLVAPLCNAISAAGLIPGTWVDDLSDSDGLSDTDVDALSGGDNDGDTSDDNAVHDDYTVKRKKMHCWLTENLQSNHNLWMSILKEEAEHKEAEVNQPDPHPKGLHSLGEIDVMKLEMETITEEDSPPSSANTTGGTTHSSPVGGATCEATRRAVDVTAVTGLSVAASDHSVVLTTMTTTTTTTTTTREMDKMGERSRGANVTPLRDGTATMAEREGAGAGRAGVA